MQHPKTRCVLGLKKKAFVCGATANDMTRIRVTLRAAGGEGKDKGYLILLVVVVLLCCWG